MRITYRTLRELLNRMSDEQLDCDVTVEDAYENECYPAELRISGPNHDSLDDNHPIIYIPTIIDGDERVSDIGKISDYIGLKNDTKQCELSILSQ